MLQFNALLDDPELIKKIRAAALQNAIGGVTITQFISEGTTLEGISSASTEELLLATEKYLLEKRGLLVTQTEDAFNYPMTVFPNV